ncbi:hypothetical protein OPV22_013881 [Ensete ventricosum]|uniref:Ribosomal protein L7Ae/L30e/S12e/Gadd45 domain-containing protein n=1 Tax=Ensete ventricosum TaxID=4639 RepID=A0AAV8R9B4_ENSVE|nr:hypothetical protein OPV22_013881 [Ensete ventricosum]
MKKPRPRWLISLDVLKQAKARVTLEKRSVAVAAAAARKGQCNKVVCVGRTRDDAHRKCGRFLHRTLRPSLSIRTAADIMST